MQAREFFVHIGMLIVEGRTPECSNKGRVEGPHCLSLISVAPHVCDQQGNYHVSIYVITVETPFRGHPQVHNKGPQHTCRGVTDTQVISYEHFFNPSTHPSVSLSIRLSSHPSINQSNSQSINQSFICLSKISYRQVIHCGCLIKGVGAPDAIHQINHYPVDKCLKGHIMILCNICIFCDIANCL